MPKTEKTIMVAVVKVDETDQDWVLRTIIGRKHFWIKKKDVVLEIPRNLTRGKAIMSEKVARKAGLITNN